MSVTRNSLRVAFTILMTIAFATGFAEDKKYLSKDELISIIKQYHPVVKQAEISVQRAKAQLKQSRGNFDPVLSADIDRKTFDGKEYYNYFNPQLTIPTWYGVDLKAGFEDVSGDNVSPELSVGRTSYVGVKLSTNSLLFDSRRATLNQAKLFYKQSEAEQRLVINDILYDALSTYWSWVREYQNYRIITDIIRTSEERLRFVRVEYEQGARAAIDTTETLSQLQTYYVLQQAALLAFQNAGLELSVFMWMDSNTPFNWSNSVFPDSNDMRQEIEVPALSMLLEKLSEHPKLQSINYKVNSLKIEQQLKAQYLVPKLTVSANMLGKGYYESLSPTSSQLANNHKLGMSLGLPLLFRDAIGGYQSSKLKVFEMQAEQNNVALQLEAKLKMYYNEVISLRNQIQTYSKAFENYQKLYTGEKFRFNNGESSLFILNSRENKLLETSQKLVELKTKWQKSFASLMWASGQLF